MFENDNNSEKQEELKQENDFLKMKMMLEHGAEFGAFGVFRGTAGRSGE